MAASSKLTEPRRKRRIHQAESSPFPVPIASIEGKSACSNRWYYYTGYLVDNCVLVSKPGDISYIYKMGYFGKGILSRSKPEHKRFISSYQGVVRKRLPPKERRFQQQRFQQIRKQRYMRHLQWYNQYKEQDDNNQCQTERTDVSSTFVKQTIDSENNQSDSQGDDNGEPQSKRFKFDDIIESVTERNSVVGCNDVIRTGNDLRIDVTHSDDVSNEVTSISTNSDVITRSDDVITGSDDVTPRNDGTSRNNANVRTDDVTTIDDVITSTRTDDVTKNDVITLTNNGNSRVDDVTSTDDIGTISRDLQRQNLMENSVRTESDEQCCPGNDTICTEKSDGQKQVQIESGEIKDIHGNLNLNLSEQNQSKIEDDSSSESTVVIIADSGDDSEGEHVSHRITVEEKETKDLEIQAGVKTSSKHGKKHKVVKKKDPYPIHEYLQLSLEEAFFLSFGLGCLTVKDSEQISLDLTSMWQTFCSLQTNFISSYVVYHNLRSKGWVPKTGIKFGSDFIVYKQGPPFYHASYSVLISMVDEKTLQPCGDEERPLTWPVISGMNRVTEHAAKEVLFCFVLKPTNMTDQEMQSPKCISRFKVQEMVMRRWVCARERQDKRFPHLIS
ncbi:uncharacterized protein LOC144444855 [Glandiceps talaboti]